MLLIVCFFFLAVSSVKAQDQNQPKDKKLTDWFTTPAYADVGYRKTQHYLPSYNTGLVQWDSHIELWLPPSRRQFAWGPYLRFAGVAGTQSDAFQNGLLGWPGLGFQLFPFSSTKFKGSSRTGMILGPLRAFGEYNYTNYWGASNTWRPKKQVRAGFDYWKAVHVNTFDTWYWAEIWNGFYWQSSNEFTDRYDSVIFANSARLGARLTKGHILPAITPYLDIESSKTKYDKGGSATDYYWENNLIGGGGLRIAPAFHSNPDSMGLTRFVIYGEYVNTACYYGPAAPSTVPRYDIRAGINFSVGNWYK